MWNGAEILREKWRAGQFATGFAVTLPAPELSEMAAWAGYDFVFVDMEHPPMGRETAARHVAAAQGGGVPALVRVRGTEPNMLKSVLDMGPDGVIFPFIHTAQDARAAVAACSYPDGAYHGVRGQGPQRAVRWGFGDSESYLRDPGQYLLRIMQIESWEGWQALDEILAVPGVDGVYLGPADLGRSLRAHAGDAPPPLEEACADVRRRVSQAGKWMGAPLPPDRAAIAALRDQGVQWGVCGIDADLLAAGMRWCLSEVAPFSN